MQLRVAAYAFSCPHLRSVIGSSPSFAKKQGLERTGSRLRYRKKFGSAKFDSSVSSASQENPRDSVAEALKAAEEALKAAEVNVDLVESLPSAREPSPFDGLVNDMKKLVLLCGLMGGIAACHSAGVAAKLAAGLVSALLIAAWGLKKGSLSPSGAAAAVVVGLGTLGCSFRMGATLLAFFFSSSLLTRLMEEAKAVDEEFKEGGQRDWRQVFCNGLLPTLFAVAYGMLTGLCDLPITSTAGNNGPLLAALPMAFLGYYCCCCGDTWASEVGQLSSKTPRLITTGRPVRKGVNGGVTLLGGAASAAGGLLCGAVFYLSGCCSPSAPPGSFPVAVQQWKLIPLGCLAGVMGSIIDSLLGATIQFSGFNRTTGRVTSKPGPDVVPISGVPILDNNLVNVASATITSVLVAWVASRGPTLLRIAA